MLYEQKLAKITKKFQPKLVIDTSITPENVREFIINLQEQYDGSLDYETDLIFSYYVCDSVINMILNCIFSNELKTNKNRIAL